MRQQLNLKALPFSSYRPRIQSPVLLMYQQPEYIMDSQQPLELQREEHSRSIVKVRNARCAKGRSFPDYL